MNDSIDNLEFSPWIRISEYKKIEGHNYPGVYVIANFKRKPRNAPNLTSSNIIYVGETTKQTLLKRISDFQRTAFYRKSGHSGGWTYSQKFLESKTISTPPENMYLSALTVNKSENESKAYIKYIERLIIWEFFKKNKSYPLCNTA